MIVEARVLIDRMRAAPHGKVAVLSIRNYVEVCSLGIPAVASVQTWLRQQLADVSPNDCYVADWGTFSVVACSWSGLSPQLIEQIASELREQDFEVEPGEWVPVDVAVTLIDLAETSDAPPESVVERCIDTQLRDPWS